MVVGDDDLVGNNVEAGQHVASEGESETGAEDLNDDEGRCR